MKRKMFGTLASLMCIAFLGALPSMGFAEEGKWTKKAAMPTARYSLSASAVNGKIYAIGGRNEAGTLSIVEEYNPTTDTWTRKADMPTARMRLATCVVNGKIYAIGGDNTGFNGTFLATVEAYDPATDTWTKKKDMPFGGRYESATVAVNGKVYVIGGWLNFAMQSQVGVYDPLTDTWEQKANGPPLANAGFAEVNGKIYFGGGWAQLLATTYEYDPATDQWTRKTDMPTPRHLLSASVLGDKLYAIGGNVQADGGPSAVVEVYHPATNTWTKGANMLTARGGLSTAVVQGKLYAIGGQTGVPWAGGIVYPTVEEYTPADWSFAVSPRGKLATTWGEVKRGR